MNDLGINKFINKYGIQILTFEPLNKYSDVLIHGFTTRPGGFSKGKSAGLNMGKNKDDPDISRNYELVCRVLDIERDSMLFSNQVHGSDILVVMEEESTSPFENPDSQQGYDGLITNKKGLTLVTFYADCVPVYLFDPEKQVIGLIHSGWRSTLLEIAGKGMRKMRTWFGSRAADIIAVIGPSIGKCCFEIGRDVYEKFLSELPFSRNYIYETGNGKWKMDLQGIVKQTLVNNGVNSDNISISNLCTKCNTDLFFSYRAAKEKTGSMAAIMQIKGA